MSLNQPFRIYWTQESPEQATAVLTGTIGDTSKPPVPIPGSALTSLTLTLYRKGAPVGSDIINARDDMDILGVNGGSVDANGVLTLILDPEDMPMLNASVTKETHVALLTWTYNSGATTGRAEVFFPVHDLQHVP